MSQKEVEQYWRATGQAARRAIGLPSYCASTIVNEFYRQDIRKRHVLKKIVSLTDSMKNNVNEKVKFIHANALDDARSVMRANIEYVQQEWGSVREPNFSQDASDLYLRLKYLLELRTGFHVSLTKDD